jgi:hypothetical protein
MARYFLSLLIGLASGAARQSERLWCLEAPRHAGTIGALVFLRAPANC